MQKRTRHGGVRVAALVAVTGLGVVACGGVGPKAGARDAATAPHAPLPHAASPSPGAAAVAGAPGPAATTAVSIVNFAFVPPTVTVKAGTMVIWTQKDEEPHRVVGSGLNSSVLGNQGSTYSFTFTTAGTFAYNCSIHPYMHGVVTVTA